MCSGPRCAGFCMGFLGDTYLISMKTERFAGVHHGGNFFPRIANVRGSNVIPSPPGIFLKTQERV